MVRLPALATVLLVVLAASSASAATPVVELSASSGGPAATACVVGPSVADEPRTAGNVSLTTLTAPGSAFDRLRNASAIAAARERGGLTVVERDASATARSEGVVALNDTVVHRLDLRGPATALFDRLATLDGRTPTEEFVTLVRSEPAVSMEYVGPTSCRPKLNLTATVRLGGLRVVPDEPNGSLYVVLDQARMAMELGGPPFVDELELGLHAVELSFPGSSDLVTANRTVSDEFDVVPREVEFTAPHPGLFRPADGDRLVLAGRTTVAPGSTLFFHLRPLDGPGTAGAVSATANRSRGFRTVVRLATSPEAAELYAVSVDGAAHPDALVAVGEETGARFHATDQETEGHIPYHVPVTTSHGGFVVALGESGETLGHSEPLEPGYVVAQFELSTPLRENETVTLVAHRDANGNGAFDPGTDEPYRVRGSVVRTAVNVALEGDPPDATTATASSPDPTTSSRSTATTVPGTDSGDGTTGGQPGFGLAMGIVGVLVAALVAAVTGLSRR